MQSRRAAVARLAILAGGVPLALSGCTTSELPAVRSTARPGDAESQLGIVDVVSAGAAGDGETDDTAPIEKAIALVEGRRRDAGEAGAGVVYFPSGTYLITRALVVPKNIVLAGEGANATRMRYRGDDVDVFLTFGAAKQIATFSGLSDISVDADGRADTTVLLYGPQEGSAIASSVVIGAKKVAVDVISSGIVGGSNKFTVSRSWIWTTGDAAVAGIRIGSGGGPISIRDTTFVAVGRTGSAPADSAGIVAIGSIVGIDNVNVEHFESHSYLDRTQADVRNVTGFFGTYGIKTSARSKNTAVYLTNGQFDKVEAAVLDQGADVKIAYCQSYWSEAYRFDQRHFRRNFWEIGSANIWRSDRTQTVLGYDSPAGGDGTSFAVSNLIGGEWQRSADVDAKGVFGTADSGFDGSHLRLGEFHLWVDASGALRMKNGAPISDTDGGVVGS